MKKRSGAARDVLRLLHDYESRNVTFIDPDGSWPIVWERAQGTTVWDPDGKKYLDLTAAFGVAAAGHANPRVVAAGQRQMARLLHAMGDVHPHALKAQLVRELSRLTFERWETGKLKAQSSKLKVGDAIANPRSSRGNETQTHGGQSLLTSPATDLEVQSHGKTIFANSGFEAVEAALKTALLATGRPGVIAFRGAYHGTGYGALNATHRELFRAPFRAQLRQFTRFVPFPVTTAELDASEKTIRALLRRHRIGAILVEPIQGRAGIRVPPLDFLPRLRRLCDRHGALLILDEIYTGFGRTGRWFACEHSEVVPDVICLGKALTGGFPLSACVGRADVMDAAWPESSGEAIHTSTYLGHPVGCAMALEQIREIEAKDLIARSERLGRELLRAFNKTAWPKSLRVETRGSGLMVGVELRHRDDSPAARLALDTVKALLRRGFIVLPEGEPANVIALTPPLTIREFDLSKAVTALGQVVSELAG